MSYLYTHYDTLCHAKLLGKTVQLYLTEQAYSSSPLPPIITYHQLQQLYLATRNPHSHSLPILPTSTPPSTCPAPSSEPTTWFNHPTDLGTIKLRPKAWALAGATSTVLNLIHGITLVFRHNPTPIFNIPNHKSFTDNIPNAMAQLNDSIKTGVIELQHSYHPTLDPTIPHPSFACILNPLGCTTKKDTDEVCPYIDPTITGLNASLIPIPVHLPTIPEVISLLQPHYCLAKRDWRHGFHQLTLHPTSRPYTAFRLANNHIARFKALPFGLSTAPAIFQHVATEFARLLHL